jgi:hypothetical protein
MSLDQVAQDSSAQPMPVHNALARQAAKLSLDMHEWMIEESYDQCYLLVDPQLRPIDKAEPLGYWLEQCAVASPDTTHNTITLPMTKDHSPWFTPLQVTRASDSQVVALSLEDGLAELNPHHLAQGFGRRIGGWFISEATSVHIGWHLARVMVQTAPGAKRMLLRIHDSSVLWLLWALLTSTQQIQLLGPIRHWFILDLTGNLIRLDRPNIPNETALEPLRLTKAQWSDVMNIQALNHALTRWAVQRPQDCAMDVKELHHAAQTAVAAARRARVIGIEDPNDLSLFAQHALQHGPQFDGHPDIAALLEKCDPRKHADPDRYSAATDGLTADDWLRIKHASTGAVA